MKMSFSGGLVSLGAAALAAVLAAAPAASPVAAAQELEEILAYDVVVDVGADGWLEVTEEIRVRALGQEIRRGIYRDFPTSFPRQGGLGRIVAPFEVVEVLRDGRQEPYTIRSVGGPASRSGVRVRVGDSDMSLSPGVYTYRLTFRTTRWIDFGTDIDRLYWNATGNGWRFPILGATARIRLPEPVGAADLALEGWTGPDGAMGQDWAASIEADDGTTVVAFRTTAPLDAEEGLTVRVAFPKGVVAEPSEAQEAEWFRMDWGPWIDAAAVVLLVLAVYLLMWRGVGVDPPKGTTVVRYDPPEGFSPAALGYVRERGYEARQLTAAVVNMAVKGALTIEQERSGWELRKTTGSTAALSNDERALHGAFFDGYAYVDLDGSSEPRVRAGVKAFRRNLSAELERRYFVTNRWWWMAGLLMSLAGFAALAWRARHGIDPAAWFLGVWLSFWTIGTGTLLWRVAADWKQVLAGGHPGHWISAVLMTLLSVPFVAGELFVGYLLYQMTPPHLVAAALALGAANVLFYHLLERPTLRGRGVLDAIDGFRRYLLATDEDRFDRIQPAGGSLELFERYLPHAIALDAENAWAERFEGALTASGKARDAPSWYVGATAAGRFSASAMTSSLSGAMASSLSASSSPPMSSGGGGGGGGSSGGGGGGGGGGGW